MRRSRVVDIPLVVRVAAAAMLLGCGADHRAEEAQRCVDRDWNVVPDLRCEELGPGVAGRAPVRDRYYWYYGGRGTGVGDRASGGSTVPPGEGTVVRPNSGGIRAPARGGVSTRGGASVSGGTSTRGGFGSTGHGISASG
jgi:hypothetical protein